jgi:hypothetical protein
VVGERERELFGSSRSFLREFNGWVSKKTREREKERESERTYLYKCAKDPTPISEKTGITPSAIFI